jgi:hypothetical protein
MTQTPPEEKIPDRVGVTSYPKVIFLWPTWILSFIFWLVGIVGNTFDATSNLHWIWLFIFTFNIFVISFEFPAGKFLLVILFILAVAIIFFTGIIPGLSAFALPYIIINKEFYLFITLLFTIVYGMLWISRRFNYLEVTSQQITYHVGIFADERRYPAPSVRFEKKTEDVFERILPPFCAKLIMKVEGGEAAEILECVPRINTRLDNIKKILEHLKVSPTTH